ncbi:23S rRNA (uracil(1939)-C(5))-methyltransferase RlmD [Fusibacter tunisiensis]|uniref:23S rRNA (Uracil1939-C5)-methyltransferase n=1 Tax=Fusibacter tunisiensis TaxID=1008308 RepID=A0ABS2MU88_9FIRM|nr:23S rRNA (uracil(1939)-C(5))-methyltransferase RlmD [Fusibacter tunisiensis]MBM7562972.1 23S rRNA (uracil1939-C5)-methyltransferase [Fusibacter tunisiensis]
MFKVKIIDLSESGHGIGKVDGFTWFVEGAVPGDLVMARPIRQKKTYGNAVVHEILKASDSRTTPPCPVFPRCGGCQIQHIQYSEQLKLKQKLVKDAFQRIGGISSTPVLPTLGMKDPWQYRNKGIYHVHPGKSGPVIGFYQEKSHVLVPVLDCLIQSASHSKILKALMQYMRDFDVEAFDSHRKKGVIREIVIRESAASGHIMIVLVTTTKSLKMSNALVKLLTETNPNIVSIYQNINPRENVHVFGHETRPLFETQSFVEKMGDAVFEISPLSFFQVNTRQADVLYGKTVDFAGLTGNEIVYDLYCGTGTLAIHMASKAKHVYGVELYAPAIEDAKRNTALNGMNNISWLIGKAEEEIEGLIERTGTPDVIVLDPPRSGCDSALIEMLKTISPSKIVYVSCKPSTLARDVKMLSEAGYEAVKIQPVDMFGHSMHVETIVALYKKD